MWSKNVHVHVDVMSESLLAEICRFILNELLGWDLSYDFM